MTYKQSRRSFLSAGLALPVTGFAAKEVGGSPILSRELQGSSEVPLKFRKLGKTGLEVTTVGFGCMITSDPSVIERAADIGINYFDTARGYQRGNNERMVGAALKSKRKELVLSTKSGAKEAADLQDELETSLTELGTDYVDIWYMHGQSSIDELTDGHIEVIEKAKKEGKVRFAGVSTHSGQKTLIPDLAKNPHIDIILTAYNFTMDTEMKAAVATAAAAGKGIVAMKVMAGGFRKAKPGDPLFDKFKQEGAMLAALKWVIDDESVDTTIPSITDMAQLEENLTAMSTDFSEKDRQILARHLDFIQPIYCRMCGSCSGVCPKGVPADAVLRYLSYVEGYGQFELARENFRSLAPQVQAVRCTDCSGCAIKCPNGVQVPQRLARAQELFA